MGHGFDSGMYLRQPAWHRLGTVVEEWPGSWAEARKVAGLEWEVEVAPIAVPYTTAPAYAPLTGYNLLRRSDKPMTIEGPLGEGDIIANPEAVLAVQPTSYHIIRNAQFGEILETILGRIGDDWAYECLFALYGGRQIVAVLRARNPLQIGPDPSKNFSYICFVSRHDGQGGLKGIPTNLRVVCANMRHMAETQAKRDGVGFTIRHTANWQEQIEKAAAVVQSAVRDGKAWAELATRMGRTTLYPSQLTSALNSLFKTDSSMTERQERGQIRRREQIRQILRSPTCEGIDKSWYGLVQAVDEWCDHEQPARSDETRTQRTLLRPEPLKAKVAMLARSQLN
jgi:phage/plasmid-like protein (TIGR03299 family)